MKSINQKLGSRKLWIAVLGVIAGVVTVVTGNTTEGVAAIIASVIGYLVAEGYIDAKAVKTAQAVIDAAQEAVGEVTDDDSE